MTENEFYSVENGVMKSNTEALRKRGKPTREDINRSRELSKEELLASIYNDTPAIRTAGIIVLRDCSCIQNKEYVSMLLTQLSQETALYTKLELCNSLKMGNEQTATWMCDFLGKIGNNQHKIIPSVVSKKKCFPLPRDIVARTIGNMNQNVVNHMFKILPLLNKKQKYELMDGIGLGCYNHSEIATQGNFEVIQHMYQENKNDELMVWKIALCCSSFCMEESTELLSEIKVSYSNQTIQMEAERSSRLISRRTLT